MRKLVAITQVTLDGVMQGPGGPEEDSRDGFSHGGWVMPYFDDDLARVIEETIAGAFDMLLGRRTYDIFAGYWPFQEESTIAAAFNRATKYVVTSRSDALPWDTTIKLHGDVTHAVQELKATQGPELHLWGSGQLLQTLTAAGLVDEYRVWTVPRVLGTGRRLFEPGIPPLSLSLADSHSTPAGVLINRYRLAPSPQP